MAQVTYTQRLDLAALRRILTGPQGGVAQDLMRRGFLVESQAKRNLTRDPQRVDSGRLRASIGPPQFVGRNGEFAVIVGTNVSYARYVHDGTGIYGPKGTPIRPRGGRYLRFKPKGSARYVYAREVKGMRPNPFLADALVAARG